MLSRTASSLFWLARSVERMEYTARLLHTAQKLAATGGATRSSAWHSALIAAGCEPGFFSKYDRTSRDTVVEYMTLDTDNPSSLRSCLDNARQNARAVRTGITSDMWDAINSAWIDAKPWSSDDFSRESLGESIDWVKRQTLLFNGACRNTMLRSEGYHFTHLGSNIERADNTARILDVKYHILLPTHELVGGAVDYVQWTAILSSVSARRAYQHLYQSDIVPWKIAQLLILRTEMPRSLRSCYLRIIGTLRDLEAEYEGYAGAPHEHAARLDARLHYTSIEKIFQAGLHEFLTEIIDETAVLGEKIQEFYNM